MVALSLAHIKALLSLTMVRSRSSRRKPTSPQTTPCADAGDNGCKGQRITLSAGRTLFKLVYDMRVAVTTIHYCLWKHETNPNIIRPYSIWSGYLTLQAVIYSMFGRRREKLKCGEKMRVRRWLLW